MKKFLKVLLIVLIVIPLAGIIYAVIYAPPIMTGMSAKTMCSCVFVTGRSSESVLEKELTVFPGLSWTDININNNDSTVTASFLGRSSKAIFRNGLGCTLLSEQSEAVVRSQPFNAHFSSPAFSQDSVEWPSGNRVATELMKGVDYTRITQAIDEAFLDSDPKAPIHTHAVLAVYNGQIVGEKYAPGFDVNSRHMGWSMTKSICNALVGILVRENRLRVDDPAPIQEWQNDERHKITVNNLLQASTGLAWQESYFNPSSDFHTMFIKRDDKAKFAASRKAEYEAGTHFRYSSGATNILSRILRQELGDSEYHSFPYRELFYKIGMHRAIIEPDASGTFVASSYGYASARDWARLGLLYLNDGMWNGERILPQGWVNYSITPAPAAEMQEYGAQIWLNLGRRGNPEDVKYPGLPHDAFVFDGFEENSVVIIPSKDLIVVRLGVTHNSNFDHARLIRDLIAALPAETKRIEFVKSR